MSNNTDYKKSTRYFRGKNIYPPCFCAPGVIGPSTIVEWTPKEEREILSLTNEEYESFVKQKIEKGEYHISY